MAAGQIGEKLDLAPATLSFHLAGLRRAGLARSRQEGRFVIYSADYAAMNALVVDEDAELGQLRSQLAQADVAIRDQQSATCCYAKSDKHWTIDPQGIAWASFHTLEAAPRFGEDTRGKAKQPATATACCAPAA